MNSPKTKYFQGLDGKQYKSVLAGYDLISKEQYVAIVELATNKVWFMPIVELSRKVLVDDIPTPKWREINKPEGYDEVKTEVPYPGYTNDARAPRRYSPYFGK